MPKQKRKPITQEIKSPKIRSLMAESDRGCVILLASILDEALERAHEAFLGFNLTSPTDAKSIFDSLTGPFGPLHSFGGKITLGYAYGVITRDQYDALNLVRKIRNEAAHERFEFALEDKGITTLFEKLAASDHAKFSEVFKLPADVVVSKGRVTFTRLSLALLLDVQTTRGLWGERTFEKKLKENKVTGEFTTEGMPDLS